MKRRRVGIVGAGPGGLAAAMLLAQAGAEVTLFERRGRGRRPLRHDRRAHGRGNVPVRHGADVLPLPPRACRHLRRLRTRPGAGGRADPARPAIPPGVRGWRRAPRNPGPDADGGRDRPAGATGRAGAAPLHGGQPGQAGGVPPDPGGAVQWRAGPVAPVHAALAQADAAAPDGGYATWPAISATSACGWRSRSSPNTSACRRSAARACSPSCRSWNTSSACSIRAAAAAR